MPLIGISFQFVYSHVMSSLWEKAVMRLAAGTSNTDEELSPMTKQGCQAYTGGMFMIYDWEQNQPIWQIDIDRPSGFCWYNNLLYINSLRMSDIIILDGNGYEQGRISHPYFNDLHSIVPTTQGFLVTSTGIDSILEIDQHGTLLYHWCAVDQGYPLMENGCPREIDFSLDHRYFVYHTPTHTTHPNSAILTESEEIIYTTLFKQGSIISIDRKSNKAKTLVSGLKHPHDLRPYPSGGWIVSDSRGNQTLLFDENWKLVRCISKDFNWVNSSAPLSDGSIIIADSDNNRIIRVYENDRIPYEVRTFPSEWGIYHIEEVPSTYKDLFRSSINLS